MPTIALNEAESSLAKLISDIRDGGEEVVITLQGKPAAKIVAVTPRGHTDIDGQVEAGQALMKLQEKVASGSRGQWPDWEELKAMMRDEVD